MGECFIIVFETIRQHHGNKLLFQKQKKNEGNSRNSIYFFCACSEGNERIEDNTYETMKAISTMSYPIVSTNQTLFYGNYDQISTVSRNGQFYGQDAN